MASVIGRPYRGRYRDLAARPPRGSGCGRASVHPLRHEARALACIDIVGERRAGATVELPFWPIVVKEHGADMALTQLLDTEPSRPNRRRPDSAGAEYEAALAAPGR